MSCPTLASRITSLNCRVSSPVRGVACSTPASRKPPWCYWFLSPAFQRARGELLHAREPHTVLALPGFVSSGSGMSCSTPVRRTRSWHCWVFVFQRVRGELLHAGEPTSFLELLVIVFQRVSGNAQVGTTWYLLLFLGVQPGIHARWFLINPRYHVGLRLFTFVI